MAILYCVVARGTVVLAKYASCSGNFAEVTDQILTKIPPYDEKLTYSHENYLFHYITENGITYFCITDDQFQREKAFLFLNQIKGRFNAMYDESATAAAIPYAMEGEFELILANEMKHYSESKDFDKISRVQGELDDLKDIMIKNIDNVTRRGEKLNLLVHQAETLENGAVTFRGASTRLQRSLFWKNIKMYVILGVVLIFVIYLIVSMACGGLRWQSCVG